MSNYTRCIKMHTTGECFRNAKAKDDIVTIVYIDMPYEDKNEIWTEKFHKHEIKCGEMSDACGICGRNCTIYKNADSEKLVSKVKPEYSVQRHHGLD